MDGNPHAHKYICTVHTNTNIHIKASFHTCMTLQTGTQVYTVKYILRKDMHMQNTYRCACICTHTYTFRHEFSRAFLQYVIFNLSFKVILELIMLNVIYV